MSLRKLFPIIMAGLMTITAISCKKDDDAESKPSMDGMLRFDVPAFVKPKDVVIMKPKGLVHPDGKGDENTFPAFLLGGLENLHGQ